MVLFEAPRMQGQTERRELLLHACKGTQPCSLCLNLSFDIVCDAARGSLRTATAASDLSCQLTDRWTRDIAT